jgi:uncharacterized protein (TIGR03435 family)
LIRLAYGPGGGGSLPPELVAGGPNWIEDIRYDVEAKAEGNASQQQRLEMLRTLLAERFKLRFHYESKETAVYILAAGKNGLKLKERRQGDGGEPFTIRDIGSLHFVCRDISMAQLATFLKSSVLVGPVADKTGLSGAFDFDLSWRPDDSQFGGRFARAKEAESDLPDLFTALRQLGLRLETVRAPVQVLRIDHAEKPAENQPIPRQRAGPDLPAVPPGDRSLPESYPQVPERSRTPRRLLSADSRTVRFLSG